MYIVRVDYDEFDPESYRGIDVKDDNTGEVVARKDSGDFMKDYTDFEKWVEKELGEGDKLLASSSFEHFLMDSDCF